MTPRMVARLLGGWLWSSAALAQGPAPTGVSIDSFQYAGTGCPDGSIAANISPDAQALTLLFDNWIVDSSTTTTNTARKNCRVDIRLAAPDGWRYAIFGLTTRGYADLESGAVGFQQSRYRFTGSRDGVLKPLDLSGPHSDNYAHTVPIDLASLPWSQCSGDMTLTIDSEARVELGRVEQVRLVPNTGRAAMKIMSGRVLAMRVQQPINGRCELGRSFSFNANRIIAQPTCGAVFAVTVESPTPVDPRPQGLLTVDSIDGELRQDFGIAWQQCVPGRWVQGDGSACTQVCARHGLRIGRDTAGAVCASGEARPTSAIGKVNFTNGCVGACTGEGNIPTTDQNGFCYKPGQTRDADRTDRTIGCFCY